MSAVPVERKKFRRQVPAEHKDSIDTRLAWLWNQRFGTVQMVWKDSPDLLDHTAATIILQAVLAKDLNSIETIFQRIEGGSVPDTQVVDEIIVV